MRPSDSRSSSSAATPLATIERNGPVDAPEVVAAWTDPATLAWIDAYMARVTGR